MNTKTLLLLLSMLFVTNYCIAELRFQITKFPGNGTVNCRGSVNVIASGTAGPFQVKLIRSNGSSISKSNINGSTTFNNLCKENYDVIAINKFGCDHYLGEIRFNQFKLDGSSDTEKIDLEKTKEADMPQTDIFSISDQSTENSTVFKLTSMPNPVTDKLNVGIFSESSGLGNIDIYSTLGEKIHTEKVTFQNGPNTYEINALKSVLPGMYIIHFRAEDFDQTIKIIKE